MSNKRIYTLAILVFAFPPSIVGQNQDVVAAGQDNRAVHRTSGFLFNYLNMAGTTKASKFQPLTQRQSTQIYMETMVNPFGFIKAGLSAGIDQWNDKPVEWEQGASGYGKRFANILGQYSIQRTVTFGLGSAPRRQPLFQLRQNRVLASYAVCLSQRDTCAAQ